MAKHQSLILEMARKGADHRHRELEAEIASLVKHFPHLGKSREGRGPEGRRAAAAAEVSFPRAPRKRRRLSAAARKKISDAQKARWAKQKEKKKGQL
jgi:hypothetical protein